jgi:hypothetical protein
MQVRSADAAAINHLARSCYAADWFTGAVRIDPLFQGPIPRGLAAAASPSVPRLVKRKPRGIAR